MGNLWNACVFFSFFRNRSVPSKKKGEEKKDLKKIEAISVLIEEICPSIISRLARELESRKARRKNPSDFRYFTVKYFRIQRNSVVDGLELKVDSNGTTEMDF